MKATKWLLRFGLPLVAVLAMALPVLATYGMTLTVTGDGSAHTLIPMIALIDNADLAAHNYIRTDALDTRVSQAGTAIPHLVSTNMTLFAGSLSANGGTFNYTTGSTPASSMDIVAGVGGFVVTPDNPAIEPGSNFSISWSEDIAGTTTGANMTTKGSALRIYKSGSANVTATVTGSASANFTDGWTVIDSPTNLYIFDMATTVIWDPANQYLWTAGEGYHDYASNLEAAYAFYSASYGTGWTAETIYEYPTDSNYGSAPSIAIDPSGDIWAVWYAYYDDANLDVLWSRRNHLTNTWSAPAKLQDGSTSGFEGWLGRKSPSIAIDSDGDPWVFWETAGPPGEYDIWFDRRLSGSWNAPESIYHNDSSDVPIVYQVAINSTDDVYVLMRYHATFDTLGYTIFNNGVWYGPYDLNGAADFASPSMVIDSNDIARFAYWTMIGAHINIYYVKESSQGVIGTPEEVEDVTTENDPDWTYLGISQTTDNKTHIVASWEHAADQIRQIHAYTRTTSWSAADNITNGTVGMGVGPFGTIYPTDTNLAHGFMFTAADRINYGAYFYADNASTNASGTKSVTASGIAAGKRVYTVSGNTTAFSISVDGAVADSTSSVIVSDTDDDWFWRNFAYLNYITITKSGVEVMRYAPNEIISGAVYGGYTGGYLSDRDENADGIIVWGASGASVSTGPFEPLPNPTPRGPTVATPTMIGPITQPAHAYDDAGLLIVALVYLIVAALGFLIFHYTRSLLLMSIVCTFLLTAAWRITFNDMSLIPGWSLIPVVVMETSLVIGQRVYGW